MAASSQGRTPKKAKRGGSGGGAMAKPCAVRSPAQTTTSAGCRLVLGDCGPTT